MLKSMTGFGNFLLENESITLNVEIKSVNSKSQDFSIRLPKQFQDKEPEVRNLLGQILERGKVGLNIDYAKNNVDKPRLKVNTTLFKNYYEELKNNAEMVGASTDEIFRIVIQMPEVMETNKSEEDAESEWTIIFGGIKEAVVKCDAFRIAEGKILEGMLRSYILKIENLLDKVIEQDPLRISKIREKLKAKVEEYVPAEKLDANRFEQELIYYIEKLDITEEKVRLKSHLDYFIETMATQEGSGKKLGFIAQEIGREINTIGSKANEASIQKWVVEMKEELEKIKEQSLNVL